jgi:hypothetical protein
VGGCPRVVNRGRQARRRRAVIRGDTTAAHHPHAQSVIRARARPSPHEEAILRENCAPATRRLAACGARADEGPREQRRRALASPREARLRGTRHRERATARAVLLAVARSALAHRVNRSAPAEGWYARTRKGEPP